MTDYWMISNRALPLGGEPSTTQGPLRFFKAVNSPGVQLTSFPSWSELPGPEFKRQLLAAADTFPVKSHGSNEDQSHLTLLVHGYNVGWQEAAREYQAFCNNLYEGPAGLGICISFDWPSLGSILGYYPDREHANSCAKDLTAILAELYEWMSSRQKAAMIDPANACRAKVSVVSHSMGNYLLQKAMSDAWARTNKPLSSSLINQLVMIAADVDNDLFDPKSEDATDGNALANLSYRITVLYTGRDSVLGASAGLKHFGTRRLGRSGLATTPPFNKDNLWQVDCSSFFDPSVSSLDIHSEYFREAGTLALIRQILRGIDRQVLDAIGATQGKKWPVPSS